VLPIHLGLVSEVEDHDPADLQRVSAAVQKQLIRDFAPIWGRLATIDPFPTLTDVPIDYWPIIVSDKFTFPGLGIHRSLDGQPFVLVKYNDSWSLTVSHEAMEAVADADGNRLVAGSSIKEDQGRVVYLVEICDPSERAEFGYTVNDILVSDFYTPNYFDPDQVPGVRYSFTGAITEPRQVLEGGYVSWFEPITRHWWQLRWFEDGPKFHDLEEMDSSQKPIREVIDEKTPHVQLNEGVAAEDSTFRRARALGLNARGTSAARGKALDELILALNEAA
jgi:hypothetical protein